MTELYLSLPFRAACTIFTNCRDFRQSLEAKYGMYVRPTANVNTDLFFSIIREGEKYRFLFPGEETLTAAPLYELDRYLFEHLAFDPQVFALHGAAVEWRGECYIFLAATTSGKTTLTAYLTECGFGYLTDDCVLLDRESFCVYPDAEPIHLRQGGLEVLARYESVPDGLQAIGEAPALRRYVYTPKNTVDKPVPLRRIYFMERTKDANDLSSLSTNESIAALMQAPITPYPVTGDYLRFLSRLARVGCYRLRYSDMAYVKELIQNEPEPTI
ncbi:MAG: hypothetical protein J6D21_07525 [Clostridia bacterium]|nr:hypothetical protein [Clostridia bacterium]